MCRIPLSREAEPEKGPSFGEFGLSRMGGASMLEQAVVGGGAGLKHCGACNRISRFRSRFPW
jgi:hypothetical protein